MSGINIAKRYLFCAAIFWSLTIFAEVTVPPLSARVTDVTGTLTSDQKATLEQHLAAFEEKKGAQIAVLMVPSTEPETIEQYSLRVVDEWKLGRKKVDDGILLMIAKEDRAVRIEVGYGLEGALNDATSKRIISEIIVPYFKRGDYYGGIEAGINSMMNVVSGEPLPAPTRNAGQSEGSYSGSYLPTIFIGVFVLSGMFRFMFGRFPGSLIMGALTTLLVWELVGAFSIAMFSGVLALLITLFGGGARRNGHGRYGGGGGFGRGGRGGFGGGGGRFGGGGASGRW